MIYTRILCLGDSLTFGARDEYGLSWPFYMAHLALSDDHTIIPEICAVNGWTSSDLLRHADKAICSTDAKEAFILIGTNDAKNKMPPFVYRANVQLLVNWLHVKQIRPYLFYLPIPNGFGTPGYDHSINPMIRTYNKQLAKVSGLGKAQRIPLDGIDEYADGVHFTAYGAINVAQVAWKSIKEHRSFA